MQNSLDIKIREKKLPEQGQNKPIGQLLVTPNGKFVISVSDEENDYKTDPIATLQVWDVATGQLLNSTTTPVDQFFTIAITPDSQTLVATSNRSKILRIWDIKTFSEKETLNGHRLHIQNGPIWTDPKVGIQRVIQASNDHTVQTWQLSNGQNVMTLIGNLAWYSVVATTLDITKTIYTISEFQLIGSPNIYKTGYHHPVKGSSQYTAIGNGYPDHGKSKSYTFEDFSATPDNLYLFTFSTDGEQHVWDLANGKEICTIPTSESRNSCGHYDFAIAITPDCDYIIETCNGGLINIIDKTTGQTVHSLSAHNDWRMAIAIMPDEQTLVSASYDETVKIWDIARGQLLATFVSESAFTACTVTKDSTIIVAESSGKIHFLTIEKTGDVSSD